MGFERATVEERVTVLEVHFKAQLAALQDIKDSVTSLERRMNQRFDEVERRFQQVDHRFEQIDRRFEQIDRRFEQVDRRFEQIDRRFESTDRRFEAVDQRFLWLIGIQIATLLAVVGFAVSVVTKVI